MISRVNWAARSRRFAAAVTLLALPLWAQATLAPPSGTVSDAAPSLTFTGGPIAVSDPAGTCAAAAMCEDFPLTTNVSAAYLAAHPGARISVDMAFTPSSDMILTVLKGAVVVAGSDNGVGQPESISFAPVAGSQSDYKIRAAVFAGAVSSYTTKVLLSPNDVVAGAAPTHTPRFTNYPSPTALGNGAGEPSFGFNHKTHYGMFVAGLQSLRILFPEYQTAAKATADGGTPDALNPDGMPESCSAQWVDKSYTTTSITTLDPIGVVANWTTGAGGSRMWVGQLGPKTHIMAYTDNDGASWSPSEGNAPGVSGVDHQTIGAGPYPVGGTARALPTNGTPFAMYYCGQDIAYANCARSDDGGITFGAAVPTYSTLDCGGLHGHIRVAPDGTAYLPNKGCGANQGVAVTKDAGTTWTVVKVPDSSSSSTDPQMALASDSTGYFCYADGTGLPKVAVYKKGASGAMAFQPSKPISGPFDIKKIVFPQAIAGDADRATCGFVGTTTTGNTEALDFPGIWHVYMATTYDQGQSWVTVRLDDPVQGAGGLCTSGTTCGANRNLLDFNDMHIDDRGRPMYGYADGCVGTCVNNPSTIARSNKASVLRMVSDKTLFKAFDRAEPYPAKGSCLAGTRNTDGSLLNWKIPVDDGAASIARYKIYRGLDANSLTEIGQTADAKPVFDDATADPAVTSYYYRVTAINAAGEGVNSNLIKLDLGAIAATENLCVPTGVTQLEDAANDVFNGIVPNQSNSPFLDVRKLSISQPYFANGDYKIYFHLKMQSLSGTLPTGTTWPVNFCSPKYPCTDTNAARSATNLYYTVRMTTDPSVATNATPSAPVYQVVSPTGVAAAIATKTADAISGYSAAGLITIVVNASDLGLDKTQAGTGVAPNTDKLSKFLVRIRSGAVTPDNMPDSLSGAGEYNTANLQFCAPNTAPLPSLVASTQKGEAPLSVTFTYSGTDSDTIDTVAEYKLNFGDGSPVQTFTSGGTVTHVYNDVDNYKATLKVKDSRGLASETSADQVIEVIEAVKAAAPFTFVERVNVPVGYVITSEPVTLSGFTGELDITAGSGTQYSINGGAFTNSPGKVKPGDKLILRHVSAPTEGTEKETFVTVGTYTTRLKTTTTILDHIPDAFDFGLKDGQTGGVKSESQVIVPVNYDDAPISAGPGAEYRVNGGTWRTATTTAKKGDTVQARHVASTQSLGYAKSYIKIGGVVGYYTSRTKK